MPILNYEISTCTEPLLDRVEACIAAGELLRDEWTSTGSSNTIRDCNVETKAVEWLRPRQIRTFNTLANAPTLFPPHPSTSGVGGVVQGEVSNCWLLSAMAAVAAMAGSGASIVRSLFIKPEQTALAGCYIVRFFKPLVLPAGGNHSDCGSSKNSSREDSSGWVYVLVDDRLCVDRNGELLFAEGTWLLDGHAVSSQYLWVPVLEKAYAKVQGLRPPPILVVVVVAVLLVLVVAVSLLLLCLSLPSFVALIVFLIAIVCVVATDIALRLLPPFARTPDTSCMARTAL